MCVRVCLCVCECMHKSWPSKRPFWGNDDNVIGPVFI